MDGTTLDIKNEPEFIPDPSIEAISVVKDEVPEEKVDPQPLCSVNIKGEPSEEGEPNLYHGKIEFEELEIIKNEVDSPSEFPLNRKVTKFSYWERESLAKICQNYSSILASKSYDLDTINKKKEAWIRIQAEFNSMNPGNPPKDVPQLKGLLKRIKMKTKADIDALKKDAGQTGGAPPKPPLGRKEQILSEKFGEQFHPSPNTMDDDVRPVQEGPGEEVYLGAKAGTHQETQCCGTTNRPSNGVDRCADDGGSKEVLCCKKCGKLFTDTTALLFHEAGHIQERSFPCEVCNKSFIGRNKLKRHMLVHSNDRRYPCSYCEKSFTTNSDKKRHLVTHTGERPHACEICKKMFSLKEHLRSHMFTHSQLRTYPCSVCQVAMPSCAALNKHMVLHTGGGMYPCSECGKTFNIRQQLTCHMLAHSKKCTYNCSNCNATFNRMFDLTKHSLVHKEKQ